MLNNLRKPKKISTAIPQVTYSQLGTFVATPLWPSVGVKPNTWKSGWFGVFRDSQMFKAQQQGPKHLALGCS